MVILENIDIDKAILQNIDIDKISNRFKFGISNRATRRKPVPLLLRFCPAFELIGKSGKCLKMAVVGGSEAEPVEWCGPPPSQTHRRSAMFLYNGRTKAIGQLNFSPVAPILVQMSTSPTNPRMG